MLAKNRDWWHIHGHCCATSLLPCPSIGPKRCWLVQFVLDRSNLFWSVQTILDGSKTLFTRLYAYFGEVQNALDPSKMVWTNQNELDPFETNWIHSKLFWTYRRTRQETGAATMSMGKASIFCAYVTMMPLGTKWCKLFKCDEIFHDHDYY